MHQGNVCPVLGQIEEEKIALSVSAFCQLSLAQKILMLKEFMAYFGWQIFITFKRVK